MSLRLEANDDCFFYLCKTQGGKEELPAHGHEQEQTLVNGGDQDCNSAEFSNYESGNSNVRPYNTCLCQV